jgi:hypothetical protein
MVESLADQMAVKKAGRWVVKMAAWRVAWKAQQ